ncbi:hypothetical protein GCK72_014865 [Caenorhabditis remanei]|uniref:F-box domain-containing protein n=1 Tax=Caenorhabditis remanei TaxID=31234 RepID=A0A6A5GT90_CAERE|nr:hypothetical protein GCK72_014865 [Caenorhabditis remanei]KAF1758407.1 hypothetical protein GCK72_014865 [Caenorhabditis remanei]
MVAPSKFPFLHLPHLARNEVLRQLTPFEIKSANKLCKSIQKRATNGGCCGNGNRIELKLSSKNEITLKFRDLRLTTWSFYFDDSIDSRSFKVMKDLYTYSWTPSEDQVKYIIFWNERTRLDHNLRLFTTGPDNIDVIERWVLYLLDLFNASLDKLHLNSQYFGIEENKRIINTFGTEGSVTTFVLENGNVKGKEDEELIRWILENQPARRHLKLNFLPNEGFRFDFNTFKYYFWDITIENSKWISLEQTFDINSMAIELLGSSFTNNEFKIIMNKWKNGWNPNWSSMKIEFSETLDIENFVNEHLFENEGDPDLKPFVLSNIFRLLPGNENTIVYNVTRSDNTVITIRIKENFADFFLYNLR